MGKKKLNAQQGIEAACILFQLNSRSEAIIDMARGAQMPELFFQGDGAKFFCTEWRAFTHAVITTGLMQNAPNSVLMGYLKQTQHLLSAAKTLETPDNMYTENEVTLDKFIDGPFSQYMPLLAQERQSQCPEIFCQRLAKYVISANGKSKPNERAKARLAAIMALLISAVNDKLEEYEILAD